MKKLSKLICLAIILSLPLFSFAAEKDDALIAKERMMWEFVKNGDMKGFASNLAPGMIEISADGVIRQKDEVVKNAGNLRIDSYNLTDMQIHWINDNTGLIIYKATVKGSAGGNDLTGDMGVSSIWVKHGEEWMGHFHQETMVPAMTEAQK